MSQRRPSSRIRLGRLRGHGLHERVGHRRPSGRRRGHGQWHAPAAVGAGAAAASGGLIVTRRHAPGAGADAVKRRRHRGRAHPVGAGAEGGPARRRAPRTVIRGKSQPLGRGPVAPAAARGRGVKAACGVCGMRGGAHVAAHSGRVPSGPTTRGAGRGAAARKIAGDAEPGVGVRGGRRRERPTLLLCGVAGGAADSTVWED
mmetsp:Transcript_78275/g.226301  ORF Transcript_78275/g.226301 Transcript_78275/m.226301 type:complete len:202 (+) Transcript_78275:785-1390(+)